MAGADSLQLVHHPLGGMISSMRIGQGRRATSLNTKHQTADTKIDEIEAYWSALGTQPGKGLRSGTRRGAPRLQVEAGTRPNYFDHLLRISFLVGGVAAIGSSSFSGALYLTLTASKPRAVHFLGLYTLTGFDDRRLPQVMTSTNLEGHLESKDHSQQDQLPVAVQRHCRSIVNINIVFRLEGLLIVQPLKREPQGKQMGRQVSHTRAEVYEANAQIQLCGERSHQHRGFFISSTPMMIYC